MNHLARSSAGLEQSGYERVVIRAHRGAQRVAALPELLEAAAGFDHDKFLFRSLEIAGNLIGDAERITEKQPWARLRCMGCGQRRGLPRAAIERDRFVGNGVTVGWRILRRRGLRVLRDPVRLNPELLPLERIRGQRNALHGAGCMELRPIHINAERPKPAQGFQRAAQRRDVLARMRERRICACGRAALLARERGEHIARTNFNEHALGHVEKLG